MMEQVAAQWRKIIKTTNYQLDQFHVWREANDPTRSEIKQRYDLILDNQNARVRELFEANKKLLEARGRDETK